MAFSRTFDVGDTVWVAYPFPSELAFTPQSRIVKKIEGENATGDATILFETGPPVVDLVATPTVFGTEALAATSIVDDVIVKVTPAVVLDATLSGVSTAAQPSVTLIRKD